MKALIIDGNNLVHRVFWISKNQKHFDVYFHVYLFLTSLKTYVQSEDFDNVLCVWDEKSSDEINPRKLLYSKYKENRNVEYSKDVHQQNFLIKGILKTLGIKNILPYKWEADDVISILCNYFSKQDSSNRIKVITADKDICQLVSTQVEVHCPIKKITYREDNFFERLNFTKENFLFAKAVLGDKSDNIDGVRGIGEKKIHKIFSKDIELTEAQKNVVARNLQLMDLSLVLKDKLEVDCAIKQTLDPCKKNFILFKQICETCNFMQILNNFETWKNVFK